MADEVDKAGDIEQQFLNTALQQILQVKSIPFSGFCLACKDPVEERRYCDSQCRETHEKRLRRNR